MSFSEVPGGGTSPRAERARSAILEAAVGVLVADRGSSMQEISDAAGVARATLHRYFPSREDLIRAIGMDALRACGSAIEAARPEEGAVAEALARLAEGLVPIGERFSFLLSEVQLERDPEFVAADRKVIGPVEALIERGRDDGTFRAGVPGAWVGVAFEALVYAAWEGVRSGQLAPRDAPGLVTTTLLDGVAARDR